jgi:hypothetical protein
MGSSTVVICTIAQIVQQGRYAIWTDDPRADLSIAKADTGTSPLMDPQHDRADQKQLPGSKAKRAIDADDPT